VEKEQFLVIDTVTDPAEAARFAELMAAARVNQDWLDGHWDDLLPQARGKYLAVAGRQAFLADTPEEVRAHARAAHPDDKGLIVRFVPMRRAA
jgi:hypothetical protein